MDRSRTEDGGVEEKMLIEVDSEKEMVVFPLFGAQVPIPVSTIKSVSFTPVEGDYACLRVDLLYPGASFIRGQEGIAFAHPSASFIKEMSFKSSNKRPPGKIHAPSAELASAYYEIRSARDEYRKKVAEEKERIGAVKQDKLVKLEGKDVPKLKDLTIRPNLVVTRKKLIGTLEAHVNGLQFESSRGDVIHICYNTVKHALFQPCESEPMALLHFHFKQPVMFGKKKYQDVQFLVEVVESYTDLSKYHHAIDRDDTKREMMESEAKRKRDKDFETFCNKVRELSGGDVEFEKPIEELKFQGSVGRAMVILKPTRTCLVQLTDWPSFLATVSDIAWVHFERVTRSRATSSFDMILIFKDYKEKPVKVGQIQVGMLDTIKRWVVGSGLPHSEGAVSLNWNTIMKTVLADPESFVEDGGWKGMLGDDEQDEEMNEEESGSDYVPSESDSDDGEDVELVDDEDSGGEEDQDDEDDEEEEEYSD